MIERAPFGNTGHVSSRVIFGAAALGAMSQGRADAVLSSLFDFGINHIDTAASYGESELRLTSFLASHRSEFFLATKTGDRTGAGARAELERSLERMGVDSIDLIQLHNLVEPEEWEQAFRPNGAVAALAAARDEGLVRFIGVTGHGTRIPSVHVRSLNEFAFDTVLFPYNYALLRSEAYRSDVEELLELCDQRGVAVQTIKSVARRRWQDESTPHFSWYEPLAEGAALERAVAFVLGRSGIFLNSSSDARLLQAIAVAAGRVAGEGLPVPSNEAMEADLEAEGISALFDGAALERI